MKEKIRKIFFLCLLFCVIWSGDKKSVAKPLLPKGLVHFKVRDTSLFYQVEIADRPETRERGLMFRSYLGRNKGMLFIFNQPQTIEMWMKDTLIPLDMIFLDQKGCINGIAQNRSPGSLETIASPENSAMVLEINAGEAKRNKLRTGDCMDFYANF